MASLSKSTTKSHDCVIRPAATVISKSPFFRLPPELRHLVYEFLFIVPPPPKTFYPFQVRRFFKFSRPLMMLLTCRTIYWEARLAPFQTNIFSFCDPMPPCQFQRGMSSMCCVLQVLRSLKPWQVRAIRGVSIFLSQRETTPRGLCFPSHWLCKDLLYVMPLDQTYFPDAKEGETVQVRSLIDGMLMMMGPLYVHNDESPEIVGPLRPGQDFEELLKGFVRTKLVFLRHPRRLPGKDHNVEVQES